MGDLGNRLGLRRLATLVLVAVAGRAAGVCAPGDHSFEFERVFSWPGQEIYVAKYGGMLGECCDSFQWSFLGRDLKELAKVTVPGDGSGQNEKLGLDDDERKALGRRAKAVEALIARAAEAAKAMETKEDEHGSTVQPFDAAMEEVLGKTPGVKLLSDSGSCLASFVPCGAAIHTVDWSCGADPPIRCLAASGEPPILVTRSETHYGDHCGGYDEMLHAAPVAADARCPTCRGTCDGDVPWRTVPVVALPRGSGPDAFQPLGFTPEGKLAFRYLLAPGDGARQPTYDVALFDPGARTVTARAAEAARTAVAIAPGALVEKGRPFVAAGTSFTLVRALPVEGDAPAAAMSDLERDRRETLGLGYTPPNVPEVVFSVAADGGGHIDVLRVATSAHSDRETGEPGGATTVRIVTAAVAPGRPRLVVAASVQTERTVDLALASVDLTDPELKRPWIDRTQPCAGAGSLGVPGGTFVGFSPAGHVAVSEGEDPKTAKLRIISLVNDAVAFDGACADAGDALARFGIRPPAVWVNGWNWDAIPIDDSKYALRLEGGALIAARLNPEGRPAGEKVVARYRGADATAVAEALPRAVWARSPHEPRMAVVIPTKPRARIVGVHLAAGFKAK